MPKDDVNALQAFLIALFLFGMGWYIGAKVSVREAVALGMCNAYLPKPSPAAEPGAASARAMVLQYETPEMSYKVHCADVGRDSTCKLEGTPRAH